MPNLLHTVFTRFVRVSSPFVALLICAALLPVGDAQAAGKLSQAKAETAIQKRVERQFRSTLDGRPVWADECQRLSLRRVRCTWGAIANGDDGFEDGQDGDRDLDMYRYTGVATATLTSLGNVVVISSRPHDELYDD